ncbi:hypothetical protein Phi17:1_gp62 [Cellulophaga phage phi17:1]|uniref:Uncharacterized protein n=1 Tax=Cellulophaga phage phi17:1 TaxID=1327980 RepID=S0A289_9CAUD|nr:hypothetical protein Phi17:1_gp62 [Cellulophaga phage phi17:1]AGO48338.1 hypothetical protein Phi17:1_gp62 [Cellulophaga phage phi17:1]
MAVPNTNTFLLSDVRSELSLPSTTSLVACFSAAIASGFDPAYSGSKDSLLNFRNYSTLILKSFLSSSTGESNGSNACLLLTPSITLYHNGSNTFPMIGDKVTTDDSGFNNFAGGNLYYKITTGGGSFQQVRIDNSGICTTDSVMC